MKNIRATRLPNHTRTERRCWAGRTQKPVRASTYPKARRTQKAVRDCQAPEKICGDAKRRPETQILKATRLRTFATGSLVKISRPLNLEAMKIWSWKSKNLEISVKIWRLTIIYILGGYAKTGGPFSA